LTAASRQRPTIGQGTAAHATAGDVTGRADVSSPPVAARRLVALFGTGSLAGHRQRFGPLPDVSGPGVIDLVERAGLRGRGGAGFPTARKLRAVVGGARQAVVLANGCEGEPVNAKDRTLLSQAPHLVLDGAVLAARAVGAQRAVVCIHRGSPYLAGLDRAIAERTGDPVKIEIALVPPRYVASEESSLVRYLNTGEALPLAVPPRPFERGVDGRPTLVDNVETLAHLATIAAWGPEWFRQLGTATDPGSTLVTIGGAVGHPGVYEIALGSTLREVLDLAGAYAATSAALVGGYFGQWVPLPAADRLPISHDAGDGQGTTVGAGAILALPREACGLAETARVVGYLAAESAGQCGPCRFGLPAVATQLHALASSRLDQAGYGLLLNRLGVIPGRGACRHPDGAIRFAGSALQVFADDVRAHLSGYVCAGLRHSPVLPVPHLGLVEWDRR
jgi:NADH:ubiquinone oxidoreductase subunit F (NADH-binding)